MNSELKTLALMNDDARLDNSQPKIYLHFIGLVLGVVSWWNNNKMNKIEIVR